MRGRASRGVIPLLLGAVLAFPAWGQDGGTARDPWEGFNRSVHRFNETADRWILKPLAQGYVWITPDPVERGVANFFDNILEIRNVVNDVLQWKWGAAGHDSGRFLVNSTAGIAGIFDVARHIGLEERQDEDFGQTLAVWGVGSGPYLVLPFLGPSTLRDGAALPLDWALNPIREIDHNRTRYSVWALNFIHLRADLLAAEGFVSGDRYVFFREAYLQRRNYLIKDGAIEDSFDDFGDFGEDEYEYPAGDRGGDENSF